MGQNLVHVFGEIVSRQNISIWHESDGCPPKNPTKYHSLTFFTVFVKWWQKKQIKIINSFCFSCKNSKSEVTAIWHDSDDKHLKHLKYNEHCFAFTIIGKMYRIIINIYTRTARPTINSFPLIMFITRWTLLSSKYLYLSSTTTITLLGHSCIKQQQTKCYRKVHLWGLRGKSRKCPL